MSIARKKAIYAVAVQYGKQAPLAFSVAHGNLAHSGSSTFWLIFLHPHLDVIIVEDDPYYFLQAAPYVAKTSRASIATALETDDEFLDSLVPSFLRYDYQGRGALP